VAVTTIDKPLRGIGAGEGNRTLVCSLGRRSQCIWRPVGKAALMRRAAQTIAEIAARLGAVDRCAFDTTSSLNA
jgi:hypothetical protein